MKKEKVYIIIYERILLTQKTAILHAERRKEKQKKN